MFSILLAIPINRGNHYRKIELCLKRCLESKEISKLWNSERNNICSKLNPKFAIWLFYLILERVELTPYQDLEAGRPQLMWKLSSAPTWELELKLVQLSNYYYCCCRWWCLFRSGLLVFRASIHFKLAIENMKSVITRCDIFFITKCNRTDPS